MKYLIIWIVNEKYVIDVNVYSCAEIVKTAESLDMWKLDIAELILQSREVFAGMEQFMFKAHLINEKICVDRLLDPPKGMRTRTFSRKHVNTIKRTFSPLILSTGYVVIDDTDEGNACALLLDTEECICDAARISYRILCIIQSPLRIMIVSIRAATHIIKY